MRACFKIENIEKYKLTKDHEKGTILLLFAVFMLAFIPMLALAVDGYFMIQSKLDEQNIAEYLSYSAISGYRNSTGTLHTDKAADSVRRMRVIQDKNNIIGVTNINTWNFDFNFCVSNFCAGDGWKIEFGQYDESSGNFIVLPPDSGGPGQLDSSSVEAVRTSLNFPQSFNFISFFSGKSGSTYNNQGQVNNNIEMNSVGIAYIVDDGVNTSYRIGRRTATLD